MTNKDLIKQYIDSGLRISEYQFNQLSNSQKKTYMRKRIMAIDNNEYDDFSDFEYNYLPLDFKLNKIKNKILNNELYYLPDCLKEREFNLIDDDLKNIYLEKIIKNRFIPTFHLFEWEFASNKQKEKIIDKKIYNGRWLEPNEFTIAPEEIQLYFIEKIAKARETLSDKIFTVCSNKLKRYWLDIGEYFTQYQENWGFNN